MGSSMQELFWNNPIVDDHNATMQFVFHLDDVESTEYSHLNRNWVKLSEF